MASATVALPIAEVRLTGGSVACRREVGSAQPYRGRLAVDALDVERPVRRRGIPNVRRDGYVHGDGTARCDVLDAFGLDGDERAAIKSNSCEPRPLLVGHLDECATEPDHGRARSRTCRHGREHVAQHRQERGGCGDAVLHDSPNLTS